jgi:L-malate glycosyltransferase
VLTVLFATRNGARTLLPVLTAYTRLQAPAGGWKLVVVDNGSTDDSALILARFQDCLPLTSITELKPGKNAALNAGLSHTEGDLVVLTDDDAVPRQDWLVRLREAADLNSGFAIFGGVVAPRWDSEPPPWLLTWVPLGPTYTVSDPALTEGPVDGSYVFGPNMAVRAQVFHAGLRFDPEIGPTNSQTYAMGSETDFVLRAAETGARAWFVRSAVVEHIVRTSQMQPSWIIKRARRFGSGQCRLRHRFPNGPEMVWGLKHPVAESRRCFGFPAPLLYQLLRKVASVLLAIVSLNRQRLLRSLWALNYVYGYAVESRDWWLRSDTKASTLVTH